MATTERHDCRTSDSVDGHPRMQLMASRDRGCTHGSVIEAVGQSDTPITYMGCSAIAVRRNGGRMELIISRGSIFTSHAPQDTAIWYEFSLTYENGYTIFKGTDLGGNTGYMSREGVVPADHPSAVMLETLTIPGLYLIRPQNGSGCSPETIMERNTFDR